MHWLGEIHYEMHDPLQRLLAVHITLVLSAGELSNAWFHDLSLVVHLLDCTAASLTVAVIEQRAIVWRVVSCADPVPGVRVWSRCLAHTVCPTPAMGISQLVFQVTLNMTEHVSHMAYAQGYLPCRTSPY